MAFMSVILKPIFLFADSQLLFWRDGGKLFLERVRGLLDAPVPAAAYVGASNGDRPEFYQLFRGAMEGIGVSDCRMIPERPSPEDLDFFDRADLILLAGGDVERGWQAFEANGQEGRVTERYHAGALLIGISAGAVQLGLHGYRQDAEGKIDLFDTFQLIPLLIDVHQEPDWRRLTRSMPQVGDYVQGLGIPSGGGAIAHPDMTVEPVRRPLTEFSARDDEVRQSLIIPTEDATDDASRSMPTHRSDTIAESHLPSRETSARSSPSRPTPPPGRGS